MFKNFLSRHRREAGDTIVEVLVAVVIISVVIAGAYQVTNQGLRIGQNSIERTQASAITAAQAETLRTLRDLKGTNTNAANAWNQIINNYVRAVAPNYATCNQTAGSAPFYLNSSGTVTATGGTQTTGYLRYWIEAYRPSPSSNYIDFHVRGCWRGVGEANQQETGIVVRLVTN